MRKIKISIFITIIFIILINFVYGQTSECGDGVDNDNDGLIDWGFTDENDLGCDSAFDDEEYDSKSANINWDEFPEFNLPSEFNLVYLAIPINENDLRPLKHGFTHIEAITLNNQQGRDTQSVSSRFFLMGSISTPCSSYSLSCDPLQPWEKIASPWNNDLNIYNTIWDSTLKYYANRYTDSKGKKFPNVNLVTIDIEKILYSHNIPGLTDKLILTLKGNPDVPSDINLLSDKKFV